MNNTKSKNNAPFKEPTVAEFIAMVWKHKKCLVWPIIVALVLGLIWLRVTPSYYTATMIVGPTASSGVAGRGARLTLRLVDTDYIRPAPVEMDKKEELSDFARFLELMTSVEIAKRIEKEQPELMQSLFAGEWDMNTKKWHPPSGVGNLFKRFIYALSGQEYWAEPDAVRMASVIRDRLIVEPVGSSAMRRIRFRHSDRDFAVQLLKALHNHADEYLRSQARLRTSQEINYIRANLGTITLMEHRQALAELLASQEQTQMMINVDLPFAADRIENAYAASTPDWPSPLFVFMIMLVVGGMFGMVMVYLKETAVSNHGK